MKYFLSMLLIAALAVGCVNVETDEQFEGSTDNVSCCETTGVFIHITHGSDDPHRALMGLMMAVKMSEDKDVAVYLDINGIELVKKETAAVTFPEFPASDIMMSQLIEKGVPVMACPGCMKALGVTEEMLLDGVVVASKEQFFSFTDGRILTLDY